MHIHKKPLPSLHIDLSPMLDVIFQLVLFFLVSTTFLKLPSLSLSLPQTQTQERATLTEHSAVICIEKDGEISVNNVFVKNTELSAVINALCPAEEKQSFPIFLYADKDTPFQYVASVFDILGRDGFSSITIITQKEALP